MAVGLCTCSCFWVCVSVGHAQSQVCGRRRASANIHSARQTAGRLDVAHSHATEIVSNACNTTQHPPKKTPTYPDKQSMQHALTSLSWSNPKIFYPAHFPPTSLKTHFHNTSSRASAQREYPQSNWIDPIDWQIHFITFSALYIFTWMVPLIIAKLDSDGSISYQVKISLNAKRVQCLKGLSELERIRVVAFPERRKKIMEKIKKRWLTFLFLFWTNQTSKW